MRERERENVLREKKLWQGKKCCARVCVCECECSFELEFHMTLVLVFPSSMTQFNLWNWDSLK